ncbi:MAG: RluA family pseudouridine synthase, partial [Ruthenibacterium sp.]
MHRLEYRIGGTDQGLSVEQFLRKNGCSGRLIVALKQTPDGLVQNGARTRSTAVLYEGDLLEITLPQGTSSAVHNPSLRVPVLYEDEDLVVYSKPAGMPCHRSGGHLDDTLENAFEAGTFRAMFRLDRDTSGAILVAKHQLAAGRLWRRIDKIYLAVVTGWPVPPDGTIELSLERETAYAPKQIVTPDGKPARTRYATLARGDNCALLECRLDTGRMHQIRAHLAQLGHPLLGDALYGGATDRMARQALHCASLRLTHPMTGKELFVQAPPPEDFSAL